MRLAFWCLSVAFLAGCASTTDDLPATAVSFEETVRLHLAAIQNRDLDALMETVTRGDSLSLIFPDGTLIETREGYRDFHPDWFADSTWSMSFERVATAEADGMGVALVKWTLTDDTPRSGRQAYLSLVFANEGGTWRLVHDQNTAIPFPGDE